MSKVKWYQTRMTSNTTPAPLVASASSEYTDMGHAWRAFDNMNDTIWMGNTASEWIQIKYPKKTRMVSVEMQIPKNGTNISPKNFRILGSKDGVTFNTLLVKTNVSWVNYSNMNSAQTFEFENKDEYLYYRIHVTATTGSGASIRIAHIIFAEYVPIKKLILKNKTTGNYYSLTNKKLFQLPNSSNETISLYGLEENIDVRLDVPFTNHIYVTYDEATKTYSIEDTPSTFDVYDHIGESFETIIFTEIEDSIVVTVTVEPFSIYDHISERPQAVVYIEDSENVLISTKTDPYSVYDHISENPQVIVYTESTDDITISTTTEPFDLYDEFGDEVEVLFYTNDEAVADSDLILEANWSPIDELEGDLEVVTWTDEPQETAQRVLEMTAIPKPQFVKLVNPKRLYGYLDDVVAIDASQSYRDEARYLFSGQDSTKWYVWNKKEKVFFLVDASTDELILKNGMKHNDLTELTQEDWRAWEDDYMNIGVFLKDNPRDTITSIVDSVSYQDYLPRNSSEITDTSLYILNTTAKINISLDGAVLKGFLSDDDLTRVQYRVLVNGENYYPSNGEFTKLGESPQNIEIALKSDSIKIDDLNTIKVEFQDFFGTVDYWQTTFIGTYSGLMFKDILGEYYSSEAGEVLQYLDFGVIIAGQTTIEHEILLKNQYGYDVENIHLYANTSNFPVGMKIEFSDSLSPFYPQPELKLNGVLKNNDEMSFFIRLKTDLYATPDANGSFDITVRADKV